MPKFRKMSDKDWSTKRLNLEYERIVFNAARNGRLYRLKVFLDHKSKEEILPLVSATTNGSTPLVMACRNGHSFVVSYLIEKCHADIEQTGSVVFDSETIKGAPPLWCAAAGGHFNLVKYLLKNKASINSTTDSNASPLRATCYEGHFEIVKYLIAHGADIEIADRHGYTCLMIACYRKHNDIAKYLIECGADVNKVSDKGNTALRECAATGNLELLKVLLQHGATIVPDSGGRTPLLSAALSGQAAVVSFFLEGDSCTKEEKIDALELLGSTFLDEAQDLTMAFECWKQAMNIRYLNRKNPMRKPDSQSPIASHLGATEVRTLSQLERLIANPNEMKVQSLLIRERILGVELPENNFYIWRRGEIYAENGDYKRCMPLWMYALDLQRKFKVPLSMKIVNSLFSFTETFSHMMSGDWPHPFLPTVFCVFERALLEIEKVREDFKEQDITVSGSPEFHPLVTITVHLVGLMCKLQPRMTKMEELEFKKAVCRFVHLNPRARYGWSPLHIACYKGSSCVGRYTILTFPSQEIVDVFLEVGACPNAFDSDGNTPLHIAAMSKPIQTGVFESLLSYGGHIDLCNNKKQTPLELAQEAPFLDILPLQFVNLQCLSAKAVRAHKLPYKGLVHKDLELFLDAH